MPRIQVDLAALRHNLELLRGRLTGPTRVMAAVKANGYGHGAVPVAQALAEAGVDWFGVATPEEALELRRAGVEGRILLLIPAFSHIPELLDAQIELTVTGDESLEALVAAPSDSRARLHLKVDTGMGRLGTYPDEALELAARIDARSGLELTGVWTHFATADEPDQTFALEQLERFEQFLADLERRAIQPELVHACNSAGLLTLPAAHYDLVRPGIALYGYSPSLEIAHLEPELKPIATITAPVTFVKRVRAGTPISYGATWRAPQDTTVATVRYGYGDGYPRLLSNRGWATLAGQRVPLVGRVCMDEFMLDVGELPVRVGDEARLLGPGGPTGWDLAALLDTIPYELLTSLSARVEREYLS